MKLYSFEPKINLSEIFSIKKHETKSIFKSSTLKKDLQAENKKRKSLNLEPFLTMEEFAEFERKSKDFGRGLSTDGMILTPKFSQYLIGTWSFCG
jgi:hypothetical protein